MNLITCWTRVFCAVNFWNVICKFHTVTMLIFFYIKCPAWYQCHDLASWRSSHATSNGSLFIPIKTVNHSLNSTPWRIWRSGCVETRIPDLCTRWRWVASFTVRPVNLRGNSQQNPLHRSFGGPQNGSDRPGEERNLAPTETRNRPLCRPVSSLSVYRLRHPGLSLIKQVSWSRI